MENPEDAVRVLHEIRKTDVELHMDDFGTGYSSLSCLHRFPIGGLKIDRSFVSKMAERKDFAHGDRRDHFADAQARSATGCRGRGNRGAIVLLRRWAAISRKAIFSPSRFRQVTSKRTWRARGSAAEPDRGRIAAA